MPGQSYIIVHGEVNSADASAGIAFKLYPARSTVERVLGATETLVITDLVISQAVAGASGIYETTDADGKRVVKGTFGASGGLVEALRTPHFCLQGITPKVTAPVGQVNATIHGYILPQ